MNDYQINFITSMELRGFARSTMRTYLAHLDRFQNYCKKHPDACGYDDVRGLDISVCLHCGGHWVGYKSILPRGKG